MPGKRPLRGASAKQQRQYGPIKRSGKRSGRYAKPAKEITARAVARGNRKASTSGQAGTGKRGGGRKGIARKRTSGRRR